MVAIIIDHASAGDVIARDVSAFPRWRSMSILCADGGGGAGGAGLSEFTVTAIYSAGTRLCSCMYCWRITHC